MKRSDYVLGFVTLRLDKFDDSMDDREGARFIKLFLELVRPFCTEAVLCEFMKAIHEKYAQSEIQWGDGPTKILAVD